MDRPSKKRGIAALQNTQIFELDPIIVTLKLPLDPIINESKKIQPEVGKILGELGNQTLKQTYLNIIQQIDNILTTQGVGQSVNVSFYDALLKNLVDIILENNLPDNQTSKIFENWIKILFWVTSRLFELERYYL
jgi:hypothetical protein